MGVPRKLGSQPSTHFAGNPAQRNEGVNKMLKLVYNTKAKEIRVYIDDEFKYMLSCVKPSEALNYMRIEAIRKGINLNELDSYEMKLE